MRTVLSFFAIGLFFFACVSVCSDSDPSPKSNVEKESPVTLEHKVDLPQEEEEEISPPPDLPQPKPVKKKRASTSTTKKKESSPEPKPVRYCCKYCKSGRPCGDSCISYNKVCHKSSGCAC